MQKSNFLLITGWILLWVLPWGDWLALDGNLYLMILSDLLRLGIAFVLFVIPGALLFTLIAPQKKVIPISFGVIPIGFMFSTLIIGIIGLLGRFLGLSFVTVKYIFALIGFLELLISIKVRQEYLALKFDLHNLFRKSVINFPLLAALFVGNLMLFNDDLFFIDDSAYLAYLTNWQQSNGLNFNDVIYGLNQIDAARFWFALYPMGQALLSALSNVPGILLLGNYLEFFLVSTAILSLYFFARVLGFSNRAAGFSVLAHISLLCWIVGGKLNSVGMWFFQSMSEDKVSAVYILAPILFSFTIFYVKKPNFRNFLLFFLAGLSITLTHPIILFYCGCIVCGMSTIAYLTRQLTWNNLVKVILGALIWLLPFIVIRLSGHPSTANVAYDANQAEETFEIDRYITIREDGLYSVPTHILKFADLQVGTAQDPIYQVFLSIPLLILFGAGLIGLLKIKKGYVYIYLFVSIGMIAFVMFPYTGRLMGYFVSARMINRVLWFAPLGLGLVVIVQTGLNYIKPKLQSRFLSERKLAGLYSRIYLWGFALLVIFGLGSPTMVDVVRSIPNLFNTLNFHRQLGQVGAFISSQNIEQVTIVTLNTTDDYLAGISAVSKPISYRDRDKTKFHNFNYFLSSQELDTRQNDSETIRSMVSEVPFNLRMNLLEKYNVKYILANTNQVDRYLEIMNQDIHLLESVYQTKDFTLLQVLQPFTHENSSSHP